MSKRDIKAKRWGRKSAKRQMAVEPVIVDGFPRGPQLRFLTQYRKFGDGREQLRDGVPDFRGGSAVMWGDWFDVRGGERVHG